jgi:hypothetical protein
MNKKLSLLAQRRQILTSRIAQQRQTLGVEVSPWRARLAMAERGLAAIRYVRSNPALWIGGAVLLGLFRKRRTGRWLKSGFAALQLLRKAYRMMPKQPVKRVPHH